MKYAITLLALTGFAPLTSADQFGDFTYINNGNSTATITHYTGKSNAMARLPWVARRFQKKPSGNVFYRVRVTGP